MGIKLAAAAAEVIIC